MKQPIVMQNEAEARAERNPKEKITLTRLVTDHKGVILWYPERIKKNSLNCYRI